MVLLALPEIFPRNATPWALCPRLQKGRIYRLTSCDIVLQSWSLVSVDVFDEQTDHSGRYTEYDIGDLKNVDLGIVPRRRQSKVSSIAIQAAFICRCSEDVAQTITCSNIWASLGYVDGWISRIVV